MGRPVGSKNKQTKVKVVKPKKPTHLRKNLEQTDEYLSVTPVSQWHTKDFLDYLALLKTSWYQVRFYVSYNVLHVMTMKKFIDNHGKDDAKLIIEGLFIFRDHLVKDDIGKSILYSLQPTGLINIKMQRIMEQSLELAKQQQEQMNQPMWKRKPRNEWTKEDDEEFRKFLRGGEAHGTQIK